jgi:hypothetical protein
MVVLAVRMVLLTAIAFMTGVHRPAARPLSRALLSQRARPLSAAAAAPRLLLTSSGLVTPALESSFHRMLLGAADGGTPPKIAMIITAQMSGGRSDGASKRSPGDLRRRRWADARKKGREVTHPPPSRACSRGD